MFKKLPLRFTIPTLFLTIILSICVGGWLAWFNAQPVYDEKQWAGVDYTVPEFILYLFNATPSNAVRVLRDGLMSELARSGQLPSGYPRLSTVPRVKEKDLPCDDKNIETGDRYFIQLSETPDNYIELPLCPYTQIEAGIKIYIVPAWPGIKVSETSTNHIFIGLAGDVLGKQHQLNLGQKELILNSLTNLGAKLYLNQFFQDLLRNTK